MEQKQAEANESLEETQQSKTTYVTEDDESSSNIEQTTDVTDEDASAQDDNEQPSDNSEQYVTKSEYDALQEKADETMQRLLRAQADLDNFRRRTRLEKAEAAKYGALNLIEHLLPVLDNFERALASTESNQDFEALVKGIEMVYRQIQQALEQEGLKEINAVGEPFNPEFHQAVMQVESEEHEEGIVVEELQKGYILADRVIRASMVKVSK